MPNQLSEISKQIQAMQASLEETLNRLITRGVSLQDEQVRSLNDSLGRLKNAQQQIKEIERELDQFLQSNEAHLAILAENARHLATQANKFTIRQQGRSNTHTLREILHSISELLSSIIKSLKRLLNREGNVRVIGRTPPSSLLPSPKPIQQEQLARLHRATEGLAENASEFAALARQLSEAQKVEEINTPLKKLADAAATFVNKLFAVLEPNPPTRPMQ